MMQNLVTQCFSVDHERLDFLFRMYRKYKGSTSYDPTLLFKKFANGLRLHMQWEEELLFPALNQAMGAHVQSATKIMCNEHATIRALLDEISQSLQQGVHCDLLEKTLQELLLMHNEKEEQVLYGKCDRVLSEEDIFAVFLEMP